MKWKERDDKQYHVYALLDPRNEAIRYIGISNDIELRYNQHLRGCSNVHVWRWLKELEKSGTIPVLRILETLDRNINSSFADFMRFVGDREAYWISSYISLGASLLNIKGIIHKYPVITKGMNEPVFKSHPAKSEIHPFSKISAKSSKVNRMKLEDFRIDVAVLTRQDLANLAKVSISSIQRAEEGKGVTRLTQARILQGLSKHLGRTVTRDEIDEFREQSD